MSIYELTVKDTNQNNISLAEYKNKVLLIVNTATGCGFTPQYDGLSKLYDKYADRGFEVLDFPCNQFLNQAPGSDEELASFCQLKFGTKFKTFAKIDVNGKNAHPLFAWLKENTPEDEKDTQDKGIGNILNKIKKVISTKDIKWNFTKFLVDRNGNVIRRYEPATKPEDIEKDILNLLQE
ncbi:MAG: glutathione peroxidase [Clostridia bacterium]|jgi:glutathione peroxidase|nr:glutathione peroxidase [Clostridia bacterium]NLV33132.1 glutathione peroxidase [Clostridiaceae bacterium]HPB16426.1 glutathione peroxidase [Clostridia bacterium]HQO69722.1 glutathione peroxidase [Clostridia bacterium]